MEKTLEEINFWVKASKQEVIERLRQEDLQEEIEEHDCKAGPEHGCDCQKFYE